MMPLCVATPKVLSDPVIDPYSPNTISFAAAAVAAGSLDFFVQADWKRKTAERRLHSTKPRRAATPKEVVRFMARSPKCPPVIPQDFGDMPFRCSRALSALSMI